MFKRPDSGLSLTIHPDIVVEKTPYTLIADPPHKLADELQSAGIPPETFKGLSIYVRRDSRILRKVFHGRIGLFSSIVEIYPDNIWRHSQVREAEIVRIAHESHDVTLPKRRRPKDPLKKTGHGAQPEIDSYIKSELIHRPVEDGLKLGLPVEQQLLRLNPSNILAHETKHMDDLQHNKGVVLKSVATKLAAAGIPFAAVFAGFTEILSPIENALRSSIPNDPNTFRLLGVLIVLNALKAYYANVFAAMGLVNEYVRDPLEKRAIAFGTRAVRDFKFTGIQMSPKPEYGIHANKELIKLAGQELERTSHAAFHAPRLFPDALIPLSSWEAVDALGGKKLKRAGELIGRTAQVQEVLASIPSHERRSLMREIRRAFGRGKIFPSSSSEVLQALLLGSLWGDEDLQELQSNKNNSDRTRNVLERVMQIHTIREHAHQMAVRFGISEKKRTITIVTPKEIAAKLLK